MSRVCLLLSLALLFMLGRSPAALAAPAATAAARAEVLKTAKAKLESGDAAAVAQALTTLSELGSDAAASLVAARLRKGLPPTLIEPAIEALVLIGKPSVAPALLELTLHRRERIRERAIAALGILKVKSAHSALLYNLDDPSPAVRAAAIVALGELGNARALPALLTAADRGEPKALESIAKIARPSDLGLIVARGSDGDVTLLRPTLTTLMERQAFPLGAKVKLVQMLAKIGSPSVRACFAHWLDSWKEQTPAPVRKALEGGIAQIDRATTQSEKKAAEAEKQPASASSAQGAKP